MISFDEKNATFTLTGKGMFAHTKLSFNALFCLVITRVSSVNNCNFHF